MNTICYLSEVIALVNKYNLKGQIEAITNRMDYMEMQEKEGKTENSDTGTQSEGGYRK